MGNPSVQFATLTALIIFSIVMIYIGVYTSKKATTIDGFLLGGRKIGAWMSAFAYGTSYFSAVIFIGFAGKNGWDVGFGSIWIGVGNAVFGCLLAWYILAKRTRNMTHNLSAKTMPEFFEGRYGSPAMKTYSALIIFVFLVPYSAAVYKGLGSMFNTIFPNVSINVCMLFVAILTAIFLVLGGYVAAVYTDFVQGIIMIVGTIAMILILTYNPVVGGFSEAINKIGAIDSALTSPTGGSNWKFLLTNILLTSFGTWGLPQMIGKYYAIKDDKSSIKKATIVSTLFALLIGVGAYYTGTLGRLYLNNALPAQGYDYVVPNTLMVSLGNTEIFSTIVLAIIMILLLSASMSTLSAIVLTSSSAISVDILPRILPEFTKKHQMLITRVLCFVFVFFSYVFATVKFAIIVSIMSFSWGVVSGSFIGPYVLGLYYKKTTKFGAWCGMVGGFSVIAILSLMKTLAEGFPKAISNAQFYGVVAMITSIALTYFCSQFSKPLEKEIVERAFSPASSNL